MKVGAAARLMKRLPMRTPCVVYHARRTVPAVAEGAMEERHPEKGGRNKTAPFALPFTELHNILLLILVLLLLLLPRLLLILRLLLHGGNLTPSERVLEGQKLTLLRRH